jgi:hypothetical protein
MNSVIKNIIAIILGWLGGSIINMGLVKIGQIIFPLEGIDVNDMYALAEVTPTLDNEYFIFPFLAHALGTLAGATIAGLIAANNKMKLAFAIGGLFLLGGIMVNYMLPGPQWFTILDIGVAYIPMAWLGGKIALTFSKNK